MSMYRTWVEISEQALVHNIQSLRSLTGSEAIFCAIIKANAYGHGFREIARIVRRNGVDAFGVDTIDEALELRELFPTSMILVLGHVLSERLAEAFRERIDITLSDLDVLKEAESIAGKSAQEARIHLKIETGNSRRGAHEDEIPEMLNFFRNAKHVKLVGISTHFANIEDVSDPEFATLQFSRFEKAKNYITSQNLFPQYVHCACSAAIILYPETHGTLVRGGIAMYGLWPSSSVREALKRQLPSFELQPVLSWKTRIVQVKTFASGTSIGYGRTEILKKQSRVAVLPVGYWDGYDRRLSSIGEVLIGGNRCKVLGRVCMNMTMVDVSAVPNVHTNQEVILLGRDQRQIMSADMLAEKMSTISYEVVTRIQAALPRLIV